MPDFAEKLSQTVEKQKVAISNSSATILAIVDIMNTISNVTMEVTEPVMKVSRVSFTHCTSSTDSVSQYNSQSGFTLKMRALQSVSHATYALSLILCQKELQRGCSTDLFSVTRRS